MTPTDETPDLAGDPDDHIPWDTTRDRGILSPEDRAFLLHHADSGVDRTVEGTQTSSERNTRLRIRKRIYNAILDFTLIYLYLPERDRKLIFSNPRRDPDDELDLWSGAIHALAFLYERLTEEEAYQNFEYSLQSAILTVLDKPGMARQKDLDVLGSVMVDIDTSRVVDLGPIGKKISREGRFALSESELRAIEGLVDEKPDEELHPELKDDLLSNVEKVRSKRETDRVAEEPLSEKWFDAWYDVLGNLDIEDETKMREKLTEIEEEINSDIGELLSSNDE